jgi:precorrin-6A/cobalt-precorrin-6A reductase
MPDRDPPSRLLILGGTGEAACLAGSLIERFGSRLAVTSALAGRTESRAPIPGDIRIGGFGGAEGLAAYLRAQEIALLIDATHPFAAEISREARLACEAAGVPRLILRRKPWPRHPLDRWIEVEDAEAAARIVARIGHRAFLTIGIQDIAAFAGIDTVRFFVRVIARPRSPLPLRFHEILPGRGPFSLAEERHLLQRNAIDVMICKASGGSATEAKIIAAREASLPVIMIRRPPAEPGPAVDTVAAALSWVETRLGKI